MSTSSAAQDQPPPAKKQRITERLRNDINSPLFGPTSPGRVLSNGSGTALPSRDKSNLPRTTQKPNRVAEMSDGFNTDVNVAGYPHLQKNGLNSETSLLDRSRDERATQPKSKRPNGMSNAAAAPSKLESPVIAIDLDRDEDIVKAVKKANSSIIQPTVSTSTSDIQEPSNKSPVMNAEDNVQRQLVKQDRPQTAANTARPRQARSPYIEMLGGENDAEVQLSEQLKSVARRPVLDMDRSGVETIQDGSDDSDSGDSNAGYKTSSRARNQDELEAYIQEQKRKGRQKMGRLVRFCDVWSHTLDGEDTYLWFLPQEKSFQIHSKGSDISYYANASNFHKYYTGGNEVTAKTALVEGPTIDVGKPRRIRYWAAFIFSDHNDLVRFRLKLNEVNPRSLKDAHQYAIIDKSE